MSEYDPEKSDNENICAALYAIAYALHELGIGKSSPGAVEFLAMQVRDALAPAITTAASDAATEIGSSLERAATIIAEHRD